MSLFQDIYMGLLFSAALFFPVVIFADRSDEFLLTTWWSPVLTVGACLLGIWFYPGSDRWTPAR